MAKAKRAEDIELHSTVEELAARWRSTQQFVLKKLQSGELEGLDTRHPGSQRAKWLIPLSSIEAYERSRSNQNRPASKPARRGKQSTSHPVTKYV